MTERETKQRAVNDFVQACAIAALDVRKAFVQRAQSYFDALEHNDWSLFEPDDPVNHTFHEGLKIFSVEHPDHTDFDMEDVLNFYDAVRHGVIQ